MTISIDDLLTPVTLAEARQSILEVCEDLDLPTTAWKSKSVVRAIVWVMAALVAGISTVLVIVAKSGFRQYAAGDWLALHAEQMVGISKIDATFATGEVTLANAGGGLFNVAARDLVVQNSTTKKTYRNDDAFTLTPSGTATVAITAEEAGSASTSAASAIDTIVTSMPNVTVTNASAVVGLDAETDPALREREGYALDALSPNGPQGAYAYVALTATDADGAPIGVNRVRVSDDSATGEVDVIVASASGVVTGTVGDTSTDLGAVNYAIQTQCVPLGIASCTVASATAQTVNVTYELWLYTDAGLDETEAETYATAAGTAYLSSRPIAGDVIPPATTGYVYHNLLEAAIASMRSASLTDEAAAAIADRVVAIEVTSPASDVSVSATSVPVAGTFTCTAVHLVTP